MVRFGTAINCMDGRVQLPVIGWMKTRLGLDFVDMITEPGPDRVLTQGSSQQIEQIRHKVQISVEKHDSRTVVVVGHHDCAGNPVSKDRHWEMIRAAVTVIRGWNLPVEVYGVWLDENWQLELIAAP